MSYPSFGFAFFLLFILLLFYRVPPQWKRVVLLVGSLVFYALLDWKHLAVLLAVTLLSFWLACQMDSCEDKQGRKKYFFAGLLALLSSLFLFKYETFFLDSLRQGFHLQNLPSLDLVAPVGISFFTLQVLGYLIDVYKGTFRAEKNLWHYALFVTYFPQIVSGPISRAKALLPQLKGIKTFDEALFFEGVKQVFWGLFQKFVISNYLAKIVDQIYDDPTQYNGIPLILATYVFAFQIYCDFAGYSDITIGIAKLFGHKLVINFKQPYFAKNFNDFWNRWHISLSNWLRDYIFMPFTRSIKRNKNIKPWIAFFVPPIVTMLASGLWHGANWGFLVWGLIHGIYLLFSNTLERAVSGLFVRIKLEKFLKLQNAILSLIVFHAVAFAWIFFRANTFQDAVYIVRHLFCFSEEMSIAVFDGFTLTLCLVYILVRIAADIVQAYGMEKKFHALPAAWRWGFYFVCLVLFIFLGNFFADVAFIYAQF